MSETGPQLTLTMPVADWQLVMSICQQAMLPYQRLGQVLQDMQRQAQAKQGQGPIPPNMPVQAQAQGDIPESLGRLAHALHVAPPP